MDDTSIGSKLDDAQAAVVERQRAITQRQDAVAAALAAGWTKYRIAARLRVKESTVRSIIATAEKNAAKEEKPSV